MVDQLEALLDEGQGLSSEGNILFWMLKVSGFIRSALGPDRAIELERFTDQDLRTRHALYLGHLQGLIAKLEAEAQKPSPNLSDIVTVAAAAERVAVENSRKVFLVHGHDDEAKQTTARFLERLGLETIILHEQPSAGRTIIEKFESYSGDIAFAVILLTPDDRGHAAPSPADIKPRARQNVIMELGYFIGKLGRTRVCALHKGGVELPSDYQGVLYIDMDSMGAWKTKLAQEFVQAKLPIDLKALLGG